MKNRETVCAVIRDLLPSYLDGLTEEATNAFVEQHLAECAECRKAKRDMLEIVSPAERAQAEFLDRLRHERERGRKRTRIIALSVLLILAVCFLPLPRIVDQTVQAVKWRAGNPEAGSEQIEVKMKGIYLDFLFLDDYYDGDIMIEGVDITQREGALSPVRMMNEGALFYADDEFPLNGMGYIVGSGGFKEFTITLMEQRENGSRGWSGNDGLMVTWPAADRESAVEMTRRLMEKYCSWLADNNWEGGTGK